MKKISIYDKLQRAKRNSPVDYPIDFVIPWVDGSDPEWRERKNQCLGLSTSDGRENRYKDWGFLQYWFRGVEKFAPWVRYVWFICDQEPPKWLNRDHPKLKIVRHENYLPEEYRPAFSANPIELNLHRIVGLSEHFVYFNDDMFLIAPVRPEYFFRNGLPLDSAAMNPVPTDTIAKEGYGTKLFLYFLNDVEYLNRDFDFHTCVRKHPLKWINPCYGKDMIRNLLLLAWPRFVGFAEDHLPNAYLKESFEKAWEQDFDILDATSKRHIRDDRDVNQWLIRIRQLAEGEFVPRKRQKDCNFDIYKDSDLMHRMIREQLKLMICLNDTKVLEEGEFKRLQSRIIADFNCILSEKSMFEI